MPGSPHVPGVTLPVQERPFHAGAYTEPPPPGESVDAGTRALQAIAKTLLAKEDPSLQDKGKVSSIGKVEERCVFYARACDRFQVSLCPGLVGREAFHALRNLASQSRPLMRQLKYPVNLTNRIAYGKAALAIGGRCHQSRAEWSLSAADFPQTTEEQFDAYRPSPDTKLEKRPRHSATLVEWHRDALRMSWALACFYGEEWYPYWESAANYLLRLGETHGYAWPQDVIFGVWAELWSRWCEELRDLDRRKIGRVHV